jgi:hypothetical protein
MGSDYLHQTIVKWEMINGVNVPIDEFGHYLDWEDIKGNEARDLTSPYGALNFAIGYNDEEGDAGDFFTCFDYATLPDGSFVLQAVRNSESGGYIEGAGYYRVSPEEATATALGMVEEAEDIMYMGEGLPHDKEGWNQDIYYFARAVDRHANPKPYEGLDWDQFRVCGIIPG